MRTFEQVAREPRASKQPDLDIRAARLVLAFARDEGIVNAESDAECALALIRAFAAVVALAAQEA